MESDEFGGAWTLRKLGVLQQYLRPYLDIFHSNPGAKYLNPYFVDGFAGCGTRTNRGGGEEIPSLFDSDEDRYEAEQFAQSSPRIALELEKSFDGYLFIERNPVFLAQLDKLVTETFPERRPRCRFESVDSNEFLPKWCANLGSNDRAVMFLDPYGAEVRWPTIEAIGRSQKVDLWLLFPCSGVLRMLPRNERPTEAWTKLLNQLFGTEEWQGAWYQKGNQSDMFGGPAREYRDLDVMKLSNWVTQRLGQVFVQTANRPLILYNRRNSPLFMLCFAAGNPKGASPACKIANHIIHAQLMVK